MMTKCPIHWTELDTAGNCLQCQNAQTYTTYGPGSMLPPSPFDSPTGPIVLWFAGEMEKKLAANRHKGNQEAWRKDSPFRLLTRIDDETHELFDALTDYQVSGSMVDASKVLKEAADVANFALMIADQANEALKEIQQKGTKQTEGDQCESATGTDGGTTEDKRHE